MASSSSPSSSSSSSSSSRPAFLPTTIPTPSPQRLQALYADFSRQKLHNPTAYAANIDWWRRALPEIVAHDTNLSDHLVVDVGDKLIDELRTGSGSRPLSLGTVTLELIESSDLYPLHSFLSSPYSIHDTHSLPWRIATYLLGKPLWWAMAHLRLVGDPVPPEESAQARWKRAKGKYVVRSNVEKAADAVVEHERSKALVSIVDKLHNPASFLQEFGKIALPGVTLSEQDVRVLLRYLERDQKAIIREKEVIKFVDGDAEGETITEVDKGVLEMKLSIQRLEDQIEEIDRRISECTDKARNAVNKKQPDTAKSYLRSRKQLEELLAKRSSSLSTIQSLLLKIESAAGDIDILHVYETSTSTLWKLLDDPRLARERVDETMEGMSEVLADHAEIEAALEVGGKGAREAAGVAVDDEEIAHELEGLIRDQKAKEEGERKAREDVADQEKALIKEKKEGEKGREKREEAARGSKLKQSPKLEAQKEEVPAG